jgi:hypothetical protein
MANLVSPRYERSVLINEILRPAEERIIEFKGLNRRTTVQEGEMSDMLNLSSDDYPVLTQRKPRGRMALPGTVVRPLQLMSRYDHIAMLALDQNSEVKFYYNGILISQVTGLTESTRMVAINNRMCFFPEKKCIDITSQGVQTSTYKAMDASITLASDTTVTISNEDARITLPSGHNLKYDDAINIEGTLKYTSGGSAKTMPITISCIIEDVVSTNTIVLPRETFIEMTGEGATSVKLAANTKIKRPVPDIDHVIEWNNRLWGASSADNTIYASKLGDPTNWNYYQGTSMDSFYAEQGTDGDWTGVALYSNHLIFFKENSMCRIYGTAPSNFQVSNTEVFGVEAGSRQSVITINDTVFYKSRIGIMAYSGGTPYCISDGLNTEFRDVVAGTEKRKYYASIHTADAGYELMVFDTEKGVWHKEDGTRFRSCATIGDTLYYIEYADDLIACSEQVKCSKWLLCGDGSTTGNVGIVNPLSAVEADYNIKWRAVFGPFDEYIEEHKIYSKLALRLKTSYGPDNDILDDADTVIETDEGQDLILDRTVKVYISINEGPWELVETYDPPRTKGDFIPIIPRRCDRYSVKIEGEGKCEIKSLTRRIRQGTFGRL